MSSLKLLVPPFILLLVYFIADTCFGPETGIITTAVLGGGEFFYTRFKEKRNDYVILGSTSLFILLGIFTTLTQNSPWEKIQPLLNEGVLCLLLAFLTFSKTDLTRFIPQNQRHAICFTPEQQYAIRHTLKGLLILMSVHLLAVAITTTQAPAHIHTFVSGPLLYLLLGLFFLSLFISNKLIHQKISYEEWLPIVNEKGDVIGKATRRSCHSGSMLLHPVVHLHILNSRGDIFLQKRSLKKKFLPGMWDTAVGGHVKAGVSIEETLKQETFEELGIRQFKARYLGNYKWETSRERELVFAFLCTSHDSIVIDNDEVDEGRYWSRQEIDNNLDREIFTQNFIHEYLHILNH